MSRGCGTRKMNPLSINQSEPKATAALVPTCSKLHIILAVLFTIALLATNADRVATMNSSTAVVASMQGFIDIFSVLCKYLREIQIFIRGEYGILLTEFSSLPNLVRDKGIYSPRAGSILTNAGPAWDFVCKYLIL